MGVTDLWICPLWYGGEDEGGADTSSILRFLRLLRLVRLIRVLKMSPTLLQFVSALVAMMGTICSIFVVLFLFLGCMAILLTHLWGHGEALPDTNGSQEQEAMLNSI